MRERKFKSQTSVHFPGGTAVRLRSMPRNIRATVAGFRAAKRELEDAQSREQINELREEIPAGVRISL